MSDCPNTPRCTDGEAAARVDQVIAWIANGAGRRQVLQLGSDAWGIGTRQIDTYLSRAYAAMRQDAERDRADNIAEGIARREALYRRCLEEEDYSTARAILTDISRLRAEYATDRASLARAGLDESVAKRLANADGEAAEVLRQVYESR